MNDELKETKKAFNAYLLEGAKNGVAFDRVFELLAIQLSKEINAEDNQYWDKQVNDFINEK